MRRDDGLHLADLVNLVGQIKGISTGSVEFRTIPSTGFTTTTGLSALRISSAAGPIFGAIKDGKALGNIGVTNPYTPPSPAQITVPVIDHSSGANAQSVWQVLSDSGFNIAPAPLALVAYDQVVPGNVIAFAPGHSVEAAVVHQYLPGLSMEEIGTARPRRRLRDGFIQTRSSVYGEQWQHDLSMRWRLGVNVPRKPN